jgi:hypothetical protein
MSRRPTHFQLLSHRFARPQDLLVILLAGPDQGNGEFFLSALGSEEGLESWSWIESQNLVERGFLNGPCFSADLPGFQVKIQSKFGDLQSFPRSSAFCNFLIWAPFLGQPWTNLIFSFWFLVAQSD